MTEEHQSVQLDSEFQNWAQSVKEEQVETSDETENDGNHHQEGTNYIIGIKTESAEDKDDSDSQYDTAGETKNEDTFVIRVRGLPWSTKEKDVREFFSDCDNIMTIHFTYSREGRPTGEAYIELGSSEDVDRALLKNRELLGQRYIEVFISKKDEMEFVLKRSGRRPGPGGSGRNDSFSGGAGDDGKAADPETVVRLRGLPFGCTKDDVVTFFDGLEIATDGIVFSGQQTPHYGPQSGRRGKPGEAYVRFINKETTERALDRHMNKIGHRYIEVFRSTVDEMERMNNQGGMFGSYGRGGSRPGPYSPMPAMGTGGPVPLCAIPFPDFGGGGGNWVDGPRRGGGRGRGGVGRGGYDGYDGGYGGYYPQPGGYFDPSGGYYGGGGGMDGMGGGRFGAGRATGHVIHMRGLPYKATANDVVEFFKPLKLVNVQILYDERSGRPSGEAEVELCSHEDATEAMKKDRGDMGGRYIELFLNSRPGGSTGVPASAVRPPTAFPLAPTVPQNGSENEVMGMMPMMAPVTTVGVGVTYAQPLVQYPGFGAYGYGQMDMSQMVQAQSQAQQQPPPPPPPPAAASGDKSNPAAMSYYGQT